MAWDGGRDSKGARKGRGRAACQFERGSRLFLAFSTGVGRGGWVGCNGKARPAHAPRGQRRAAKGKKKAISRRRRGAAAAGSHPGGPPPHLALFSVISWLGPARGARFRERRPEPRANREARTYPSNIAVVDVPQQSFRGAVSPLGPVARHFGLHILRVNRPFFFPPLRSRDMPASPTRMPLWGVRSLH